MKRAIRFTGIAIALMLLLALAALAWVINDEAFIARKLENYTFTATGRTLAIGQLELDAGARTRIRLVNVHLGNADWATQQDMFRAERAELLVDLRGLFSGEIILERLALDNARLNLEENDDGQANWDLLPATESSSRKEPALNIAWRQLELKGFELTHEAPGRKVPLDFRVSQLEAGHDASDSLNLVADGTVNARALSVRGSLQPFQALVGGGSIDYQLDASLGDISLASRGSVADVKTGEGVNLNLEFTGPEIERLLREAALPEFSTGAFDVAVQLDAPGKESISLDIDGDFGSFDLQAKGSLDRFVNPSNANMNLEVSGPDLKALGEVFGVSKLPGVDYTVKAQAQLEHGLVQVRQIEGDLGANHLAANGKIGTWPTLKDTSLSFEATGPDIREWGALMRFEHWHPNQFSITGQLTGQDGEIAFSGVKASVGETELGFSGKLGELPTLAGGTLDIELDTPNIHEVLNWSVLQPVPHAPVHLAGGLQRVPEGMKLDNLAMRMADNNTLLLNGVLAIVNAPASAKPEPGWKRLSGSDLSAEVAVESFAQLGGWLGVEGLPDEPLSAAASVQLDANGVTFSGVHAEFGPVQADMEGTLDDVSSPASLQLQSQFAVANASSLQPYLQPYVQQWMAFDLPDQPLGLSFGLDWSPDLIRFQDVAATLGQSDIEGHIDISSGSTPEYSGSFRSSQLDFSWLPNVGDSPKEVTEKPARLISDEPFHLLTIEPLRVDIDVSVASLELPMQSLTGVKLGLHLTEDELRISPLELADPRGGSVSGVVTLRNESDKLRATVSGNASGFRVGMAASAEQDPDTYPTWDVTVQIDGLGGTMRELLMDASGRIQLILGTGQIANSRVDLLFSDIISELLSALNPFKSESPYTNVECGAVVVSLADGQAVVDPLIAQTDKIIIASTGTVALDTEKLDFSFNTRPKKGIGISTSIVINPLIKLGGTLSKPSVNLDAAGAAVSSSVAVATSGLSLLGKSLFDRYFRGKNPCGKLVADLKAQEGG